jgi:outer membrane receptor protein involved in Fe transport
MNRGFTTTTVVAVLIICIGVPAVAQEVGEIHGRIVDFNDLPLPGVTIAIKGQATRSVISSVDGRFRATGLVPGTLNLTATMPGFVTIEETIKLAAGATVEIDFQMHPAFRDTVIVSASRTKILLEDTPTTISVVGRDTIETRPAQNVGDLLREVPGANVVQSSARDVNVATRGPSPFLTGTQLALVDGRPIYFDFFNVIFWDLASVQTTDIEQIEVVRGPASTMWGANAATGVVNIVTRAPRTSQGLEFAVIGGLINRSSEAGGTGAMGSFNIRWADAPTDKIAYRLSAGVYYSDPFERPTGTIPEVPTPIDPPVIVGGGSYEDVPYDNNGTLQPKFDLRIDQEIEGEGRILYAAGVGYTEGIIQTPIGPFDAQRGTNLAYGQIGYNRGSFRAQVFANYLQGKAPSLISLDSHGDPLNIDFINGVYDLDVGWSDLFGGRHLMSFGGNIRYNTFDLSIAPNADNRIQAGVYFQDEINLGTFLLALAARADYFTNLDDINFSPRAALIWTPIPGHSFKASVARAFRAPSAIENFLELSIIGGYIPLDEFDPRVEEPFPLVVNTWGNPDLKAETHDSVEVGYSAVLNGGLTRLEINAYVTEVHDFISTTPSEAALIEAGVDPYYTSDNPPPGWPLHPIVIDFLAQLEPPVLLPSDILVLNIGSMRNSGVELSVNHTFRRGVTLFGNYSYQTLPEMLDPIGDPDRPKSETVNTPPFHRFNVGAIYNGPTYLGNLTVNYSDEAFFAQGLQPFYYGYSDPYTLVSLGFGRRWKDGWLTTSLKVLNLLDDPVKQHVFGDILRRTVMLEALFRF